MAVCLSNQSVVLEGRDEVCFVGTAPLQFVIKLEAVAGG
jgi:hypothetical protein